MDGFLTPGGQKWGGGDLGQPSSSWLGLTHQAVAGRSRQYLAGPDPPAPPPPPYLLVAGVGKNPYPHINS